MKRIKRLMRIEIPWKRMVFEFISVSFAVFMALLADQWNENRKDNELANQAFENILSEIGKNQDSLKMNDAKFEKEIRSMDSLLVLIKNKSANINMPEISIEVPTNTAWEAAKLTQAINHMDIEAVDQISQLYVRQEIYSKLVQKVLDDMFFSGNVESYEEAGKVVKKIRLLISNLHSIEGQVLASYSEFLKKYSKK